MADSNKQGIQRLAAALRYSCQGIVSAFQREAAFRQEVACLVLAFPLALWLGDSALEKTLLIGSVLMVLVVELLNSAIEAAVDLVSKEPNPLAGHAKDMGSAAVLMAIGNAVIIWVALLWPL